MKNKILKSRKIYLMMKSGFSLVESLVVIGLMLVMAVVVLADNKNENKIREEVDAASRQLVTDLRSIQNDALSGKRNNSGEIACRIEMSIVDSDTYAIDYFKNCPPATPSSIADLKRTVDLKNVAFGVSSGEVSFTMPSGIVAGSIYTGGGKIKLSSTKDPSVADTICIYSGSIKEERGDVSCL